MRRVEPDPTTQHHITSDSVEVRLWEFKGSSENRQKEEPRPGSLVRCCHHGSASHMFRMPLRGKKFPTCPNAIRCSPVIGYKDGDLGPVQLDRIRFYELHHQHCQQEPESQSSARQQIEVAVAFLRHEGLMDYRMFVNEVKSLGGGGPARKVYSGIIDIWTEWSCWRRIEQFWKVWALSLVCCGKSGSSRIVIITFVFKMSPMILKGPGWAVLRKSGSDVSCVMPSFYAQRFMKEVVECIRLMVRRKNACRPNDD